jgi:hypothetical protein
MSAASKLSSAVEQQVQRVLSRLQRGPATTVDLRREEDVIHPAGRIATLRRRGHSIDTLMIEQQTDAGAWHTVGQYHLRHSEGA